MMANSTGAGATPSTSAYVISSFGSPKFFLKYTQEHVLQSCFYYIYHLQLTQDPTLESSPNSEL